MNGNEESKEDPQAQKAKVESVRARVDKVLAALDPKSKANQSNKFRSFM